MFAAKLGGPFFSVVWLVELLDFRDFYFEVMMILEDSGAEAENQQTSSSNQLIYCANVQWLNVCIYDCRNCKLSNNI